LNFNLFIHLIIYIKTPLGEMQLLHVLVYLIIVFMFGASTRQWFLLRQYKHKLTRNVNTKNVIRQTRRIIASEGEDHNFFQIVNSNHNLE